MPESGFLEQRPRSPTSLIVVVAMHGAALTALALSKTEVPPSVFVPTVMKHIPLDQPPPDNPAEPVEKPQVRAKSQIDTPEPIVPQPPRRDSPVLDLPQQPVILFDPGPSADSVVAVDPPLSDPVRIAASLDPRSELQPAYPASEQRAGAEGTVVVVLTIGADGRVKAVRRISAASDAFWRATERHALRHWRFKPATVDGVPVESTKRLTVHFRLDA